MIKLQFQRSSESDIQRGYNKSKVVIARDVELTPEEIKEQKILVDFTPRLDYKNSRKLSYHEKAIDKNKIDHIGQRKLLLSEVEFLTKYGDLSKNVLYVGAASGLHHLITTKWFPSHEWYLYDLNPFESRLYKLPQIHIFKQYFTDADAEEYKKKFFDKKINRSDLLYISDIRTDTNKNSQRWEEEIWENMLMQERWIDTMKPEAYILKFRLPYTPNLDLEYLDGDLRIQPWAPYSSTEVRLMGDKFTKTKYNSTEHEQAMFRHNLLTRVQDFKEIYGELPINLTRYNYDSLREVQILRDYLEKFRPELFVGESISKNYERVIGKITKEASIEINKMIEEMDRVIRKPIYGETIPETKLLMKIFDLDMKHPEIKKIERIVPQITIENYNDELDLYLRSLYDLYKLLSKSTSSGIIKNQDIEQKYSDLIKYIKPGSILILGTQSESDSKDIFNRYKDSRYIQITDKVKLPFNKKYDNIFCLNALHHLENPIEDVVNLLNKGGCILIKDYDTENPNLMQQEYIFSEVKNLEKSLSLNEFTNKIKNISKLYPMTYQELNSKMLELGLKNLYHFDIQKSIMNTYHAVYQK